MTRTQTMVRSPVGDAASLREVARALGETVKPGITRLVAITALLGYALAAIESGTGTLLGHIGTAAGCVLGVVLAAGGANALNMWWESAADARMRRTRGRPLPTGRAEPGAVLWFGTGLSLAGVVVLAVLCNVPAALLALLSVVSYVLVYTPLKSKTVWCTVIGAIPGALPPLIGAAAGSGEAGPAALTSPVGWALFAVLFLWQLPHFYAIAWMYREDYALGGMRMLPTVSPDGRSTAIVSVFTAALLLATSLALPSVSHVMGWATGIAALALGIWLMWRAIVFASVRTDAAAKALFLATIAYLPLLLVAAVGEAATRALL